MNGTITLWLPAPHKGVKQIVKDGKIARVATGCAMTENPLIDARMNALQTLTTGRNVNSCSVGVDAFMNYAIAVIRRNYVVNDAELTELIGGKKWHAEIINHLLGGDENIRALAGMDRAEPIIIPSGDTAPAPRRKSFMQRLVSRWKD